MVKWIFRLFGARALRSAVAGSGKRPPLIDLGLGFTLMRDRRVPVGSKALALALGIGALIVLAALELPVEALIAALLNVPGIGFDLLIDGIEVIAGPLLFGSLFLTRLAPRDVVERLRAERYGVLEVPSAPAPPRQPAARAYRRA